MPQPHNAPADQQGTLPEPATTDSSQTKRVLLTGTTGFLGQAVLQSLLESNPDMQLTALVRPRGTLTGRTRLERLLRKPVFSSWADRTSEAAVAEALAGVEVI
ncbi:MAG: SDR family oxidoreductase, partial [Kocuria sp.]|nr:SDR family oxidoreductase [Kocuria sp.]